MLVHLLNQDSEQAYCGRQFQDIDETMDEMWWDLINYYTDYRWDLNRGYIWCPLCTDHPLVQLKLLAAVDLGGD
jgi:hypothetical protein